jgi:uncharacterized protein
MRDLLIFAAAGFAASFVDGALGMGFGPTSSSILLGAGLAPAAVSATVNLAKVATGIAAGISHWRFKNINKKLVLNLAVPGMIGALLGVTVLSNIDGKTLKPILAALLTIIGLRILVRFSKPVTTAEKEPTEPENQDQMPPFPKKGVRIAAFLGGITNGMIGAWGPVVTPFLLHRGAPPRYAIGCVNTAEVFVASASAVSLIATTVGRGGLNFGVVAAMLIGGVAAAPVAAWVIRYIPARPMGVAVAGLLLLTNARELAAWAGISSGPWVWAIYSVVVAAIVLALFGTRLMRAPSAAAIEPEPAP